MWKLMTNANWMRDRDDRIKFHSAPPCLAWSADREPPHSSPVTGLAAALSRPSTTILAFTIFVGHASHHNADRHGDLLRTARGIGDHAAADRAAEMLAPKFLPIGGIERIEVAAHIAEEHDAAGRRSHAADDRVVGLQAPFPDAGVGVDGVDPSRPGPGRSLPNMLNGLRVAIPAHGCPIGTDRSSSILCSVTVSHHSTSPTMMRFVLGS